MAYKPYEYMQTKTLKRMRKKYQKKLAQKRKVASRHEPGTSYHTRATREAKTYADNIAELEARLSERGEL